jgi:hypothetical protein
VAVIGGGIAYASIPGADGTISACYNKTTGQLRVVDADAGQVCKTTENPLQWEQAADPVSLACPEGTVLSTGVCIETTPRAATSHGEAEADCASVGRRLPSPGELSTARVRDDIDLGASGEWTDDLADIATASTFKYFVITERGNGVQGAFDDVAYRCVAGMTLG